MLFYVMLFLASLAVATLIIWLHGLAERAKKKALRANKLRIHANHIPTVTGPGMNAGVRENTPVTEMAGAPAMQSNSVLSSTWNGSIKHEERVRPKEPTQGSLNAYLERKREEERANEARPHNSRVSDSYKDISEATSPSLSAKGELYSGTGSDKTWKW